jgi:SAM-dependent methyltransferase
MTETSTSAEQIRAEYRRREREIPSDFYSLQCPANLFLRVGQLRGLAWAIKTAGLTPLNKRRILEVGCGQGNWLTIFESFDALRSQLAGIDLEEARAEECRRRLPGAEIMAGDATNLPWEDGQFDMVFQSTVFTSILDASMKKAVAAEMLRVLRPDGAIVWYDFHMNNPRNPHVRGVGRREIASLFPKCDVKLRRVTLAPPLARRLVRVSWIGCEVLEKLRFLNSHYFGVLRRTP